MGTEICAGLGVLWQFARARKGVSEWWTLAAFGVAVLFCSWLWSDWTWQSGHAKESLRAFIEICGKNLTMIAAANQGTSVFANLLSKVLNPNNPLVPVTNSK